jgi:hypothetical protein
MENAASDEVCLRHPSGAFPQKPYLREGGEASPCRARLDIVGLGLSATSQTARKNHPGPKNWQSPYHHGLCRLWINISRLRDYVGCSIALLRACQGKLRTWIRWRWSWSLSVASWPRGASPSCGDWLIEASATAWDWQAAGMAGRPTCPRQQNSRNRPRSAAPGAVSRTSHQTAWPAGIKPRRRSGFGGSPKMAGVAQAPQHRSL